MRNETSMTNIRIIPIQDICVLCEDELPERDTTTLWIGGWICRTCLQLLRKMHSREGVTPMKFVRVQ